MCKMSPFRALYKGHKKRALNEPYKYIFKIMRYHISKHILLEIIKEVLELAGVDDAVIENRADEYMDIVARDWSIDENDNDDEYYIINSHDYE